MATSSRHLTPCCSNIGLPVKLPSQAFHLWWCVKCEFFIAVGTVSGECWCWSIMMCFIVTTWSSTEFLLVDGQEVAWFTMICTVLPFGGGDGMLLDTAVAFLGTFLCLNFLLETCVLALYLLLMFNDVLLLLNKKLMCELFLSLHNYNSPIKYLEKLRNYLQRSVEYLRVE